MKIPQRRRYVEDLALLALIVFRERNAQRRPANNRAQIKAEARPHLREAIHWARKTRDTLYAKDLALTQMLFERAVASFVLAELALNAPYIEQGHKRAAALVRVSRDGGAATAEAHAMPELDDLILGCLKRGEKTRDYTKEWADSFKVSASTVRRHIKRIKAELAPK